MLKALIQLPYSVSGNVKIQNFVQFIKVNDFEYVGVVKNSRLTPLNSSARYSNIECNLLTSDYSQDIRRFYQTNRNNFFTIPETNLTVLDDLSDTVKSNFNTDFSWGCKRISYRKNLGCTHTFLAPIWTDGEIPDEFRLRLLPRTAGSNTITISIPLKGYKVQAFDKEYLNHLPEYLKRYCSQLDEKVVRLDPNNKYAYIFGTSVRNGGFCQVKNTTIKDIWEHQMPVNAFDFNICKMFQLSEVVIKQILPLSFSFNLNELLPNFNILKYQVVGEYIYNNAIVPFVNFLTDYTSYSAVLPTIKMLLTRDEDLHINYANFNSTTEPSNIFQSSKSQDFYLNEGLAEIYQNHPQKYTPYYFKWQIQGSSLSAPYIVNLSEAYNQYLWQIFDKNYPILFSDLLHSNILGKYFNVPIQPVNHISLWRSVAKNTSNDTDIEVNFPNPISGEQSILSFKNQRASKNVDVHSNIKTAQYISDSKFKQDINNEDYVIYNLTYYNQWFDTPYIWDKGIEKHPDWKKDLQDNLEFLNGKLKTLIIGPGQQLYNNQCLYKGILYDFTGEDLDEVRVELRLVHQYNINNVNRLIGPTIFMSFQPSVSDALSNQAPQNSTSAATKWTSNLYQQLFNSPLFDILNTSSKSEVMLYSYGNKYFLPYDNEVYRNQSSQDISIPQIQSIGIPVEYPLLFNISNTGTNPITDLLSTSKVENSSLTKEILENPINNALFNFSVMLTDDQYSLYADTSYDFLIPYNSKQMGTIEYVKYLERYQSLNKAFVEQYNYALKSNISTIINDINSSSDELETFIKEKRDIKYSFSAYANRTSLTKLNNNEITLTRQTLHIPLLLNTEKISLHTSYKLESYNNISNYSLYWIIDPFDTVLGYYNSSDVRVWDEKTLRALIHYAWYLRNEMLKAKQDENKKLPLSTIYESTLRYIKNLIISVFSEMPTFPKKFFILTDTAEGQKLYFLNEPIKETEDNQDARQIVSALNVLIKEINNPSFSKYTLLDAVISLYLRWENNPKNINITSKPYDINKFIKVIEYNSLTIPQLGPYEIKLRLYSYNISFECIKTPISPEDQKVSLHCYINDSKNNPLLSKQAINIDIVVNDNNERGFYLQIPSFEKTLEDIIEVYQCTDDNNGCLKNLYYYLFYNEQLNNILTSISNIGYSEHAKLLQDSKEVKYDIVERTSDGDTKIIENNYQGIVEEGLPVFSMKRVKSKIYTTSENMHSFRERVVDTYLTDRAERFKEYIYGNSKIELETDNTGIKDDNVIDIDYRIDYSLYDPENELELENPRFFFINDEKYIVKKDETDKRFENFRAKYKNYFLQPGYLEPNNLSFTFNETDILTILREYRQITSRQTLPSVNLELSSQEGGPNNSDTGLTINKQLMLVYLNVENPYHRDVIINHDAVSDIAEENEHIFSKILHSIKNIVTDEGILNKNLYNKYKGIFKPYRSLMPIFYLNYNKEYNNIVSYFNALNKACDDISVVFKRTNKQLLLSLLAELKTRLVLWKIVKEYLLKYFFENEVVSILYKRVEAANYYNQINLKRCFRFATVNNVADLENILNRQQGEIGYLYMAGNSIYLPSEVPGSGFQDLAVFGVQFEKRIKHNEKTDEDEAFYYLRWEKNGLSLQLEKKSTVYIQLNLQDIEKYGFLTLPFEITQLLQEKKNEEQDDDKKSLIDSEDGYLIWRDLLNNLFTREGVRMGLDSLGNPQPGFLRNNISNGTESKNDYIVDLRSFYKYSRLQMIYNNIHIPLWYLEEFVSFENLDIYFSLIERKKAFSQMWVEQQNFEMTYPLVFKGNENKFTYKVIRELESLVTKKVEESDETEEYNLSVAEKLLVHELDHVRKFKFNDEEHPFAVIFTADPSLFVSLQIIKDYSQLPYVDTTHNKYPYIIQDILGVSNKEQIIDNHLKDPKQNPLYMVVNVPSVSYGLYKDGRRGLLRYNIFVSPDNQSFYYSENTNIFSYTDSSTILNSLMDSPVSMRQMVNTLKTDLLPVVFNTKWSVKPSKIRLKLKLITKDLYDYDSKKTTLKTIEYIDSNNTREFLRYFHYISPVLQPVKESKNIPLWGRYRIKTRTNYNYEYIFPSTSGFSNSNHKESYWDVLSSDNISYTAKPQVVYRDLYEDKWFNDSIVINLPSTIRIRYSKLLTVSDLEQEEQIAKEQLTKYFVNNTVFNYGSLDDFTNYLFFNYEVKYIKDFEKYENSEPYYSLTLEYNLY